MVSYWKTQWFRVLVGFVALGFMCYYLFKPGVENAFAALCLCITAMIWFLCSIIEYHRDRIELLEKKAEKYDALCEEVSALREQVKTVIALNQVEEERVKRLEQKITQSKFTI